MARHPSDDDTFNATNHINSARRLLDIASDSLSEPDLSVIKKCIDDTERVMNATMSEQEVVTLSEKVTALTQGCLHETNKRLLPKISPDLIQSVYDNCNALREMYRNKRFVADERATSLHYQTKVNLDVFAFQLTAERFLDAITSTGSLDTHAIALQRELEWLEKSLSNPAFSCRIVSALYLIAKLVVRFTQQKNINIDKHSTPILSALQETGDTTLKCLFLILRLRLCMRSENPATESIIWYGEELCQYVDASHTCFIQYLSFAALSDCYHLLRGESIGYLPPLQTLMSSLSSRLQSLEPNENTTPNFTIFLNVLNMRSLEHEVNALNVTPLPLNHFVTVGSLLLTIYEQHTKAITPTDLYKKLDI
ncbi:MAG: hypothetical protein KDH94_02730, partial [Coxiellaceae bacterium]|nr:hypothetical protein [Coxiellaceae bacterium]